MHVRWCRFRFCGGCLRINCTCAVCPRCFRLNVQNLTATFNHPSSIYRWSTMKPGQSDLCKVYLVFRSGVSRRYTNHWSFWCHFSILHNFINMILVPLFHKVLCFTYRLCVATKPIRNILVLHVTVPRRTTNDVISWSVVAAQVQHPAVVCLFLQLKLKRHDVTEYAILVIILQ